MWGLVEVTPFQICCFFLIKVKSNIARMRSEIKDTREVIRRMLLNSHNYINHQMWGQERWEKAFCRTDRNCRGGPGGHCGEKNTPLEAGNGTSGDSGNHPA